MKWGGWFSIAALAVILSGCASSPTPAPEQQASTDAARAAEINTSLGVAYMQRDDLDQAMSKLRKALHQAPDYAPAHTAVAVLYERLDEPGKAREHYRRALRLAPDDPSLHNNYGQFLCNQGERDTALEQFRKAAADPLYQRREFALGNAGLCLLRANEKERAEEYLRRALEINPRFAPALLPMAELRLEDGHALSARGYYQRYLEQARQTPETLWLGIRIERELGDEDALASYKLLLKSKYPDSAETKKLLESEKNDR